MVKRHVVGEKKQRNKNGENEKKTEEDLERNYY